MVLIRPFTSNDNDALLNIEKMTKGNEKLAKVADLSPDITISTNFMIMGDNGSRGT
jgi:hypothetical protein